MERREKRSRYHGKALDYWLNSISKRYSIDLVIADNRGLLIANNKENSEKDIDAALTADPKRARKSLQWVEEFAVNDDKFYLGIKGDNLDVLASLAEVNEGTKRILNECLI